MFVLWLFRYHAKTIVFVNSILLQSAVFFLFLSFSLPFSISASASFYTQKRYAYSGGFQFQEENNKW